MFLSADGGSDGLGDVPDRRQVLPRRCQQSEGFRARPESLQHQLHRVRTQHAHSDLHPLPGHPHTQVTNLVTPGSNPQQLSEQMCECVASLVSQVADNKHIQHQKHSDTK